MPPVLMIQLKRFQFSPLTQKNQKILQRFSYPPQIDFARWTVDKQNPQIYSLYAVLVHQGSKAQSGHYYVFLNIKDKWYKFNDEKVVFANHEMVFDYNFGGQIEAFEFEQRQLRVKHTTNTLKSTAYMLVYIKKDEIQLLLNSSLSYPEWIKQRNIDRIQQQNEKKQKKNYFPDIKLLYWDNDFNGKKSQHLGLIPKEQIDHKNPSAIISKLYKTQSVDEWLKQKNEECQLFVHCFHLQKQILLSTRSRNFITFNVLLKDCYIPSFIMLPVQPAVNHFLVVVKLYKIDQNQQCSNNFDKCFCFPKQASYENLINYLRTSYEEENWRIKYYIQDIKTGINEIKPINHLLRHNSPSRNCLIIIIVEKIWHETSESNQLLKWYNKQWNKAEINLKSIDNEYDFILNVDKSQTISQLRKAIYEHVHQNQKYSSSDHIVIKAKIKRNSKLYIQATQNSLIKDLVKYDNVIKFSPSLIKVQERVTQIQCHFYYRFKNGYLSEQIVEIIDRKRTSQEIFKQIVQSEEIKQHLSQEGFENCRILLLTKDLIIINDVIDQNGLILAKTQLLGYISKQKSYCMVVEGQKADQKMNEGKFIALIHNSSKTGQKFGNPKYMSFNKDIKLNELRTKIVNMISEQNYYWEDKMIPCNPFKVRITMYVKDLTRGIELEQSGHQLSESGDCQSKGQNKSKHGRNKEKAEKTIASEFQKNKIVRIQITHLYISKSIQRLRIDVD